MAGFDWGDVAVVERHTFLELQLRQACGSQRRSSSESALHNRCAEAPRARILRSGGSPQSSCRADTESLCSTEQGCSSDSEDSSAPSLDIPVGSPRWRRRSSPVDPTRRSSPGREAQRWLAHSVRASCEQPRGLAISTTAQFAGPTSVDAPPFLGVGDHKLTTLIFRNIPRDCPRDALTRVLDGQGFRGRYDFVHVPVNFQDMTCLNYAVVNMVDSTAAKDALEHFEGFQLSQHSVCSVTWNCPSQGLEAHIARYRDSPVMHESVPRHYKPALYKNGVMVPFPPPTKRLRAPRIRHPKTSAMM